MNERRDLRSRRRVITPTSSNTWKDSGEAIRRGPRTMQVRHRSSSHRVIETEDSAKPSGAAAMHTLQAPLDHLRERPCRRCPRKGARPPGRGAGDSGEGVIYATHGPPPPIQQGPARRHVPRRGGSDHDQGLHGRAPRAHGRQGHDVLRPRSRRGAPQVGRGVRLPRARGRGRGHARPAVQPLPRRRSRAHGARARWQAAAEVRRAHPARVQAPGQAAAEGLRRPQVRPQRGRGGQWRLLPHHGRLGAHSRAEAAGKATQGNRDAALLGSVFRYAKECGLTEYNPCVGATRAPGVRPRARGRRRALPRGVRGGGSLPAGLDGHRDHGRLARLRHPAHVRERTGSRPRACARSRRRRSPARRARSSCSPPRRTSSR
jgi:hypothetical protein